MLASASKNTWLLKNGFTSEFQNRFQHGGFDLNLKPPENIHRLLAFFEKAIGKGFITPTLLLTIDDWPLYLDTEMMLLMNLRAATNEIRPLKDAPCHVFKKDEAGLALGMFALTIGFKWKSSLYAAGSGLAMHNWEGDYLECFFLVTNLLSGFKELSAQFGFLLEQSD